MTTASETFTSSGTTFTPSPFLLNGSVQFDAFGGRGGGNPNDPEFGPLGGGGRLTGAIPLLITDVLNITIGFQGSLTNGGAGLANGGQSGGTGPNGGWGGGGSTGIKKNGSTTLVIVGGGGGMGGPGSSSLGVGGDGGEGTTAGFNGGGFGFPQGGQGSSWGGAGAGGSAGGFGGDGFTSPNANGGQGGAGTTEGGGGGGAGLWGGGGGAGYNGGFGPSGGGGGGGVSWWDGTIISPTNVTGAAFGNGIVTITQTFADPPRSSSLLFPTSGSKIDSNAAGVAFDWTYNPGTDSGTQTAYALRIKADTGSYQYWNATSGALQSGIVWNASATSGVTVPPGILADGHTYNWSVATQESHYSLQGTFATDAVFTGAVQPTVTITSPGTISMTSSPTVAWTVTLGGGLSQINYRVIIYSDAQHSAGGFSPGVGPNLYDSGTITSGLMSQVTPGSTVPNGSTAWAYVMVNETGPIASNWAFQEFVVNFNGPNAPTLSVIPNADSTTGDPMVTLLATGNDNPLSSQDSTFVGGIGDWVASAGDSVASILFTPAFVGGSLTWALDLSSTTAGSQVASTATGTAGVPVTAGQSYSFVITSFPGGAPAGILNGHGNPTVRTFQVGVNWYNASGTQIGSTVFGSNATESLTAFVQAVLTNTTAPSGAAFAALVVQVNSTAVALTTPGAITITHGGTAGSTSYSYRVTALNAYGETLPGTLSTTASGNATLSGTNTNILNWTAVTGATAYRVYRTAGGATQGVIGTPTSNTFTDTGLTGNGAVVPTVASTSEIHLITQAGGPYNGSTTTWNPGGFIGAVTLDVQVSLDGGTTWTEVYQPNPVVEDGNQHTTVNDGTAVFNESLLYRARLVGTITNQPVSSAWVTGAPVTLTERQWWISIPELGTSVFAMALHRGQPSSGATATNFPPVSFEIDEPEEQGIYYPPGLGTAIVTRGVIQAEQFVITLTFISKAEYESFVAIRRQQKRVLFRSDMAGKSYYMVLGPLRPSLLASGGQRTTSKAVWQVTMACNPVAFP